ncbi:tail fiber assembly protein [Achromobacter xylosoxidans]|uniref:tail fiber assembly protein n=1 Tax=Alcaligenes xylosoxydans xylosoxydans TaxID=85698 RepID=UPI0009E7AAE1|nr:tail fiber assembly protein [Achromobacter xylosoxidans]
MHYSATLNSFFPAELKNQYDAGIGWPSDAVEVDSEIFEEFALLTPPAGKRRIGGPDGLPVWADDTSSESKTDPNHARAWRDSEIARVAWLRDRHRDESDLGVTQSLTDAQYRELLGYIQELREWPSSDGFPEHGRPAVPAFAVLV